MNTPIRRLSVVAFILLAALLLSTTWIQSIHASTLNADSRNSRTLIDELSRERGAIMAGDEALVTSEPVDDIYKFQRTYHSPEMYAHVTGFYSLVYGANGIEGAESQLLAGTSDQQFYRRLADVASGRQRAGATVHLTIDPAVQEAAYNALGDQKGAVVALDPKTGNILAMVSRPSFDPNELASHERDEVVTAWDDLNGAPGKPLVNRAIGGNLYPPGSVFKVVTSAAALESGTYTQDSLLPGPASLSLPQTDRTISNSGGGACGGGQVTMLNALRTSCNTAYAHLGMELGGEALKQQADKFGFDQDLRIPMRVSPSTVPTDLNPPQEAMTGIGQYETRVSPLQMAMVAAGVANDGEVMRPNLVSKVVADDLDVLDEPRPSSLGRAMSADNADQLTTMMESVVDNGTGRAAQISGVEVAGKTGTAQNARGAAPHAWFIAFAPADDPQIAVAVVVENGGNAGDEASGGRTAAPIARAVIQAELAE